MVAVARWAAGADREEQAPRRLDTALFKTPPHSLLAAAASDLGIETSSFELVRTPDEPRIGDSVTGLVTLIEPRQTRQWMVELKIGALDVEENKPPEPLTLYSSSGNEFSFESANAAVDVRTLGPLAVSGKRNDGALDKVTEARAVVNREFLALGFDRACRTVIRLKEARQAGRIEANERFGFAVEPYEPEEIAVGKDIVERAGLTSEDERAFAATFPALMTYVQLVRQTKGLSGILEAVVERPSIWSIILRFGRITWNLRFESAWVEPVDPVILGLPRGTPTHQLPFTLLLNDQPALDCMLVVLPPNPPMLTSAGIVGLMARRPESDERLLVIRVLAARRGEKDS
ncbi:MAG: hypothetical protein ACREIA_16660 [Opitutaceae bacterium]